MRRVKASSMFSPVFALVYRRGVSIFSANFCASILLIMLSRSTLFAHITKGISPQTFKVSSFHSFKGGRLSGLVMSKIRRAPWAPS